MKTRLTHVYAKLGLISCVQLAQKQLAASDRHRAPTLRMPREQCEQWVDLLVGYAEQVTRTIGGRMPH